VITLKRLDQIYHFWFDQEVDQPRGQFWFMGGANAASEQFRADFEYALEQPLTDTKLTPRQQLSLIVLYDQLGRNLFRGLAKAFAGDSLALNLCKAGLEHGSLNHLRSLEQIFFCMPLQHSESLEDQKMSMKYFRQIAQTGSASLKAYLDNSFEHAKKHHDIVAKFGRFPHRNQVLNRTETQAEQDYLASGGERFGQ